MSRNTARVCMRVEALAEELASGAAIRLRTDSDAIRPVVDAVVAYLVEEYPSQDLYIPSGATYPVAEIRAAVRAGESMRSICQRFRTDRRTVYRLLDGEDD